MVVAFKNFFKKIRIIIFKKVIIFRRVFIFIIHLIGVCLCKKYIIIIIILIFLPFVYYFRKQPLSARETIDEKKNLTVS